MAASAPNRLLSLMGCISLILMLACLYASLLCYLHYLHHCYERGLDVMGRYTTKMSEAGVFNFDRGIELLHSQNQLLNETEMDETDMLFYIAQPVVGFVLREGSTAITLLLSAAGTCLVTSVLCFYASVRCKRVNKALFA